LSYAAAIVGAEYILRLVTPGTHDWNKFVTVEELSDLISQCMLLCIVTKGAFLWENPNPDSCIQKQILRFFT